MIVKSLNDGDGYEDKENMSEIVVEEGYSFSSDSELNNFFW